MRPFIKRPLKKVHLRVQETLYRTQDTPQLEDLGQPLMDPFEFSEYPLEAIMPLEDPRNPLVSPGNIKKP